MAYPDHKGGLRVLCGVYDKLVIRGYIIILNTVKLTTLTMHVNYIQISKAAPAALTLLQ